MLDAAVDAIRSGVNQYPPGPGMPVLREAIAEHQRRFYGLDVDPDTEVLVTAGATEALAGALLGMLDAGDEVVLFEPMYDSYQACIALAGGVLRPVVLRARPRRSLRLRPRRVPSRGHRPHQARSCSTRRTTRPARCSPATSSSSSPAVAREHDLLVVTDEVYEHLVFNGAEHVPMAHAARHGRAHAHDLVRRQDVQHDRLEDRLDDAAPRSMVDAATMAKQFLTYVNGAPFQPAIAAGLRLARRVLRRRSPPISRPSATVSLAGLGAAGFDVFRPEATYFTTVDIRPVRPDGDGMAFCLELPERIGVVAIPNQVFYAHPEHGRHLVRFACCKRLDVHRRRRRTTRRAGAREHACESPPSSTTSSGTTATPTSPACDR